MFHCANCWFERWQGRSLSDSQQSFKRRRLHAGTSVLIGGGPLQISEKYSRDSGISDTRTTHMLYCFIKREHIDSVSGS